MQISLNIKDSYYQQFLELIKTLPSNAVKVVDNNANLDDETQSYMKTEKYKKDKTNLHEALEEIQSGKIKPLSHKDVWKRIEEHTQDS